MRIALVHAQLETRMLARYPSFVVPTLLFPALFFLIFVVPAADRIGRANELLASFVGFGFLGVAFFQFGVGMAIERASPWDLYLRTLPLSLRSRLAGRTLSALVFAAASGTIVVAVALALTDASIAPRQWLELGAALLAGSIPFALLGISIGYLVSPKGALPVANVLFLALAYLGGLWTGAERLPAVAGEISPLLPTRHWLDTLSAAVTADPPPAAQWLCLVGWTVVFGLLAAVAYRRDEGVRYR
jgi:ABC-2 type transport system permease protein